MLGDLTSYWIGRRLGREFLVRHGPKLRIGEKRLEQVESYFQDHGGKTILIGRFIGLVRALAPFIAGSSGLPLRRFLPFSVIGCGVWATLFSVLGYVFYRSFDQVTAIAGKATLAFGITAAAIAAGVFGYRRLRRPEQRRRLRAWVETKPVIGPAWRLAAPRVRFLGERLTPGELGLDLTSALMAAGVGLYVFSLYADLIAEGRGIPADGRLLDFADDLRTDTLVDVVKVVTDLGSFATVAVLVFGAGLVLLARRRVAEFATLMTGAVLVYLAVQAAKAGVDRPRPPMPLVDTRGSSYPSGHAAYSTVWVATALVMSRALPGFGSRALVVGLALAVTVAVGLSRVFLRVHYWSDVAGGWALGAALFGAVVTIALVIEHIRNNDPARTPAP